MMKQLFLVVKFSFLYITTILLGNNQYFNQAVDFQDKGEIDSAIIYYQKAIENCPNPQDTCIIYKIKYAEFLRSIHEVELSERQIKQLVRKIDSIQLSDSTIAYLYNRYAAIIAARNASDSDIVKVSQLSLQYSLPNNFLSLIASSYNEIGYHYLVEKKDSAIWYFNQSAELFFQDNNIQYATHSLTNLMRAYHNSGKYNACLEIGETIINQYKDSITDTELRSVYYLMFASSNNLNRDEDALQYVQDYYYYDLKIKDQKYNSDLARLVTKIKLKENQQELEKRELELVREKHQKNVLVGFIILIVLVLIIAFYLVVRYNKQRKKISNMFSINHQLRTEANHRIKNNLQLVYSLVYLKMSKVQDPQIKQVLSTLTHQIKAISLTHENLFGEQLSNDINIETYIEAILTNFRAIAESLNITFQTEIPRTSLPAKDGVYLGILITELITNSIKYAFSEIQNPKIEFKIQIKRSQIIIDYQDNGKGIPEGTNLKLITIICQQSKGTFDLHGDPRSQFHIELAY